jgi:hypothetical protein
MRSSIAQHHLKGRDHTRMLRAYLYGKALAYPAIFPAKSLTMDY